MNIWTWLSGTFRGSEPRIVIPIALAAGVLIALAIVVVILRRRSARRRGGLGFESPAAILEEVRSRLENLPSLPQLSTPIDVELSLENPFNEQRPASGGRVPAPPKNLPMRRSSPPLPSNAVDPITGKPDEQAYREWLKEWLLFAEQYGDETVVDPSRASTADEQSYQ